MPLSASAITITYVNPGPADSRVYVGFANDSSGNTTTDLVSAANATSRSDTLYGPLPPLGELPSFDAMTYAAAELGTNLNAPLGTGVRSVYAPLNLSYFQAHGETLAGSGSYASHAYAFSGDTTATAPMPWTVHVDPSGGEVAGTPVDVTISGAISGQVVVAGAAVAAAAWSVTAPGIGTVMSGTASQSVPGSAPFTDAGSLTFSLPLGSTFQLLVDYDLSTSGSGSGANSTAEIVSSLVEISADFPPAMLTMISGTKLLLVDQYAAGKAKVVLVAKDTTPGAIAKGPAAGPPGLSGTLVLYQLADPTNRAVYQLSNWAKNGGTVATYLNKSAAPGASGVRKALIKPDKLVKVLARNLGDGDSASGDQDASDLDLSVLTPADSIIAALTITNIVDSSTRTLCAQFDAPVIKSIGGGTGVKLLSKTSSTPATCVP